MNTLSEEIDECVRAMKQQHPYTICLDNASDLLLRCKSALERNERDAERYRWLRDAPHNNRMPHITQYPYCPEIDKVEYPHFTRVGLNVAIDSARAGGEGK